MSEDRSVTLRRLTAQLKIVNDVLGGLTGRPFHWGDAERQSYVPKAAALGITLLTRTALSRKGYMLKRGAQPVGTAYFGAPLQREAELYVLECQCVKRKE